MDIEKFLKQDFTHRASTVLQNFYERFTNEQYQQIVRKYTGTRKKKMEKNWVDEIRQKLPDVRILEINGCVSFQFKNTYFQSNWGYVWKGNERWLYQLNMRRIDDLAAMMYETNEQIPLWNAEFLDLVNRYRPQLTKLEWKRRRYDNHFSGFYDDWLLTKPQDLECEKTIFEKMQTEWQHLVTVEKPENNVQKDRIVQKLRLQNLQLTVAKWTQDDGDYYVSHLERNGEDFGRLEHTISLAELYELDELIPEWKRQFDEIEYENQKREKVKSVAQAGINTLVEAKMKELGCEYKLDKYDDKCTLAVKLQKKRQVKVSLPYGNMELASKRLAELKTYVDALNAIPITVRISTYREF